MSDQPIFPLDAEQIVRGLGWLAAEYLNRTRRPDERAVDASAVTIALAEHMGVQVRTIEGRMGRRELLPYRPAGRRAVNSVSPLPPQDRRADDAA